MNKPALVTLALACAACSAIIGVRDLSEPEELADGGPSAIEGGGADVSPGDGGAGVEAGTTVWYEAPAGLELRWLRATDTSLVWITRDALGTEAIEMADKVTAKTTKIGGADGGLDFAGYKAGPYNGLVTDATHAFAIAYETSCRKVVRLDSNGTSTELNYACGIALGMSEQGGSVYVSNFGDLPARIYEIPKLQGTTREIAQGQPADLTCATAKYLYFMRKYPPMDIKRQAKATGSVVESFASVVGEVTDLVCDEQGPIWLDISGVTRALETTTPATAVASRIALLKEPSAPVVFGDHFYAVTGGRFADVNKIERFPKSGGSLETVWTAPARVDSFAVDPTAVFVLVPSERRIYRIPR